jgi:hypothetical protein
MRAAFVLAAVCAALAGCKTVCVREWSTSQTIGQSTHYGVSEESTITVGGNVGAECEERKVRK